MPVHDPDSVPAGTTAAASSGAGWTQALEPCLGLDRTPVPCGFSADIGLRHVRHPSSGTPHCPLPEVLRDRPGRRDVDRLTFADGIRRMRLVLRDEATERLVSFRERADRQPPEHAAAAIGSAADGSSTCSRRSAAHA